MTHITLISCDAHAYSMIKLFLSLQPLWRGFSGLEGNFGFNCIFQLHPQVSLYPLLNTRSIPDKGTARSAKEETGISAREAAGRG